MKHTCCVYLGSALASYGFGEGHPFGPDRHDVFVQEFYRRGLDQKVDIGKPVSTTQEKLEYFHTHAYVEKVKRLSASGQGYLDQGDTPAFPGIFEAASIVVGTGLRALASLVQGEYRRAFVPIAGLHHARRDSAAGFCVFNDCGILIEALRRDYGIQRVAYVDIDAHHGDGVFYAFEDDPDLVYVDLHEDGRFLYPGTGFATETGKGRARGTKLNIPMRPRADDGDFLEAWQKVESWLHDHEPQFILFQCGADSLAGDPITELSYSEKAHAHAAASLCRIANQYCDGKLLAMGGGGYNRANLARAWCEVVNAFVQCAEQDNNESR